MDGEKPKKEKAQLKKFNRRKPQKGEGVVDMYMYVMCGDILSGNLLTGYRLNVYAWLLRLGSVDPIDKGYITE